MPARCSGWASRRRPGSGHRRDPVRRPRWVRHPQTGTWRLTDPWQTGFVDLHGDQGLLGQVTGRTSAAVVAWLTERGEVWRDPLEVVAIDPAAVPDRGAPGAATGHDRGRPLPPGRAGEPGGDQVGQRVTRERLGRRGRPTDRTSANHRLLRGWERLSDTVFARMWNGCIDHDPSNQLLAAWIARRNSVRCWPRPPVAVSGTTSRTACSLSTTGVPASTCPR